MRLFRISVVGFGLVTFKDQPTYQNTVEMAGEDMYINKNARNRDWLKKQIAC